MRTARPHLVLGVASALLASVVLASCADQPLEPTQFSRTEKSASLLSGWTLQTPVCSPTHWPAATGHPNGRIYVFGGTFNGGTNRAQIYDPGTKQWYLGATMPALVYGAAAAVGTYGRIYVAGGSSTGLLGPGISDWLQIYDPATDAWTLGTPLPNPTWTPGAAAAIDGRIYVFGGDGTLTRVQIYNPSTDSWSFGAPMPGPRFELAAVTGPDSRMYVIGGMWFAALATMDIYDPPTNTWTSGAPMSRPRNNLAAAVDADGRIYAIGGSTTYSATDPMSSVESYDYTTNTWRAEPAMNVARAIHGAGLAGDGHLYAISGRGVQTVEALGASANNAPGSCGAPRPIDEKDDDNTPPVITADVSGTLGDNDWYVSNVVVSWTVTDGESGVTSSSGCDATTLTADASGETLTCGATSEGGSASESVTIKLDKTAPTVTYAGSAGTYTVAQTVNITCSAGDNLSGVASHTCADITGAAYTFGAGNHTYSASATDYAGNVESGSVTFTVVVTYAGVCELVQQFVSNAGIANSLCVKLRNAEAAEARGRANAQANLLDAFRSEVKAQAGNAISGDYATVLLGLANEL